ncbi:MAG: DUF2130 domain-containing protein [Gammaproteobacteria bacterium]|nr:DUF2130 domain-containing protein [Gammaproteobacteria bacterium]MCB1816659.1 DUF2130 domain-containing protein [Gammaproteobacteria bacterium]MCP5316456.1 DUF2130 domain-containing protein [Chromatiaceae bacterium]MCP5429411.1 DUF2130 domain-containing protein [Chromatiaceae bacterium]MCP5434237.1 DUF2130 domain-containing protein [Chromatiaceae bacterium]
MTKKIIVDAFDTVACPHCGKEFMLQDAIAHQLIERYESEYETRLEGERRQLRETLVADADRAASRRFGEQIAQLQAQLAQSAAEQAKARAQLEASAQRAIEEARRDSTEQAQALQAELALKDKKLAGYRETEMALRTEKAALEEQQRELALEVQRKVDAESRRIKESEAEAYRLREAEWRKKIDDAQKANEDLKRKLEQGSQQLQGEVLELEIEGLLATAFPYDGIEPVKKGARGADVIQTVRLRSGAACGRIVWESKRAENWSNAWVAKLKDDQQSAGGELAVLVSTAFPAGIDQPMVMHEGVWLVRPDLVKALAEALRTVLIESQRQKAIAAGKGESMEALYSYITSAQFAQKVRAVVDAYQQMRDDLEKEKSAMQRLWKKREAQLERITTNMLGMCGELQGVSQQALPQLEDIGLLPS